jgi:hypothetical protein
MLYRWWRMSKEDQRRVWCLYGWFCGLMLCGSCFGAVTWAARMMHLDNSFKGNDAFRRANSAGSLDGSSGAVLFAQAYSWSAVFLPSYAFEFMCLSAAKLMVLDRMSDFAMGQNWQDEGMRKRWAAGGRIVMTVVVLGNAVGLSANIAAAVHAQRAAEAASTASVFYATNRTREARQYFNNISQTEIALVNSIVSVQSFCEVAVLLIIVVAFVVAAVFCARLINSVLLAVKAASAPAAMGRELKRRVLSTTGVVFVAFVVRSAFSIMRALVAHLQDGWRRCPGQTFCDAGCNNMFLHMLLWMNLTPELQLTIVLVSSPLTLLVALWGMTSKQMLQAMKGNNSEFLVTIPGSLSRRVE